MDYNIITMEKEQEIKLTEITAKAYGVAEPTEPQKTEVLKALCNMDKVIVENKLSLPLLSITATEENKGEISLTIVLGENPTRRPENELEEKLYSILSQQ